MKKSKIIYLMPALMLSLTSCSSAKVSYGELVKTDYNEFIQNYEDSIKTLTSYETYKIDYVSEYRYKEKVNNRELTYEYETYVREEQTIKVYDKSYLNLTNTGDDESFIAITQKLIQTDTYGANKTIELTNVIENSEENASNYSQYLLQIKSQLFFVGIDTMNSLFLSTYNGSGVDLGRSLYNIYQNSNGDITFKGLLDISDVFSQLPSQVSIEPVNYVIQYDKYGNILFEGLENPFVKDVHYSSSSGIRDIHLEYNQTTTSYYDIDVKKPENGYSINGNDFVIPEITSATSDTGNGGETIA